MVISVLVFLALFAGFSVVTPVTRIGKTPKKLTADVAAGAASVLLVLLVGVAYAGWNLDLNGPGAFALWLAASSWFVKLVLTTLSVGRTPRRPLSAGAAVYESVWSLVVLAGLLYLLTLAV